MKKLKSIFAVILLICGIITIAISSCKKTYDLGSCKGDEIVGKSTDFRDRGHDEITVRHSGKLVNIKVTRFELNKYELGDTIK